MKSHQQVAQRRLPSTGKPNQRNCLSTARRNIHILENPIFGVIVLEGDLSKLDLISEGRHRNGPRTVLFFRMMVEQFLDSSAGGKGLLKVVLDARHFAKRV